MPFESRKAMTWGPGRTPDQVRARGSDEIPTAVALNSGDEVPAPVKLVLIQSSHVVKVDKVSGKEWKDQSQEAQEAWAKCNGQSILFSTCNGTGVKEEIAVKVHASRMVFSDAESPEPKRRRVRADYVPPVEIHKNEAQEPAPSASQEDAGGEASADESAPPTPDPVDVEGTGLLEEAPAPKASKKTTKKKRGRPRKK